MCVCVYIYIFTSGDVRSSQVDPQIDAHIRFRSFEVVVALAGVFSCSLFALGGDFPGVLSSLSGLVGDFRPACSSSLARWSAAQNRFAIFEERILSPDSSLSDGSL